MSRIELVGTIDEHQMLNLPVPAELRPGPVKVILEVPTEHDEWAGAIARVWAPDWNDTREDIYTLEDGEPVDGAR
jgi:hypothetical protein